MKRVVKGLGSDGCGFSSVLLACVACMHAGYVEDEHKNGTLAI